MIGITNGFCGIGREKSRHYNSTHLRFHVSSSPFLTIRVLQKLADDERHTYSRAAAILKKHLYSDDLLSGANTIDKIRAIRDELIALLARGGFAIRQWASNDALSMISPLMRYTRIL